MKLILALVMLGLAACGGTATDPAMVGNWIFQIGNNAAGHQLDDGHGMLTLRPEGDGYSDIDATSTPIASQMFGAATWTRNGTSVRIAFSCPSVVPIANPRTIADAMLTPEGTLEGVFHDPLGDWDGTTFTAHRL